MSIIKNVFLNLYTYLLSRTMQIIFDTENWLSKLEIFGKHIMSSIQGTETGKYIITKSGIEAFFRNKKSQCFPGDLCRVVSLDFYLCHLNVFWVDSCQTSAVYNHRWGDIPPIYLYLIFEILSLNQVWWTWYFV